MSEYIGSVSAAVIFILIVWGMIYRLQSATRITKMAGMNKLKEDETIHWVWVMGKQYPIQQEHMLSWLNFSRKEQREWAANVEKKVAKGEIKPIVDELGRTNYIPTEKGKQITYHKDKYYLKD